MLARLTQRELLFLGIGAVLVLFLLIFLGGRLIWNYKKNTAEELNRTRVTLQKLYRLRSAITAMPSADSLPDMNEFKARIYTLMEQRNLKGDVRERLESISPREETMIVEVRLNGITLEDLIHFVHDIEFEKRVPCSITALQLIRPFPEREIYDVGKFSCEIKKRKAGS